MAKTYEERWENKGKLKGIGAITILSLLKIKPGNWVRQFVLKRNKKFKKSTENLGTRLMHFSN